MNFFENQRALLYIKLYMKPFRREYKISYQNIWEYLTVKCQGQTLDKINKYFIEIKAHEFVLLQFHLPATFKVILNTHMIWR